MQDNKSVPIGSPKGQTEPMGVKEQLINSNWLSHTKERTDAICQKAELFITTAVRTSNPTAVYLLVCVFVDFVCPPLIHYFGLRSSLFWHHVVISSY
jgi:hypothetical protein